jgi:hypothetical protein
VLPLHSTLDENKNAVLSGATFGTCELRTCTGTDGLASCGTVTVGQTCTISCDEEFYLPASTVYTWCVAAAHRTHKPPPCNVASILVFHLPFRTL